MREYTEQVALLGGEPVEKHTLKSKFGDIFANYLQIIQRQKWLMAFRNFFDQLSTVIPYVLAAPFYFLGKITLGMMTQTANAFFKVQEGLNFFVAYYVYLADFRSVLDRLTSFDAAIERALTRLWQSPVESQVHFDPSWSDQSIRAAWSRVLAETRA